MTETPTTETTPAPLPTWRRLWRPLLLVVGIVTVLIVASRPMPAPAEQPRHAAAPPGSAGEEGTTVTLAEWALNELWPRDEHQRHFDWRDGEDLTEAVLFIVIMAVGMVAWLPALPFVVVATHLFGWWALPWSMLGMVIGAMGGYSISRWGFHTTVERLAATRRSRFLTKLMNRNGFRGVFIAQVIFTPVPVIGYVSGALRLKVWSVCSGMFLGGVPGTLLYVVVTRGVLAEDMSWQTLLVWILINAVYVGVVLRLYWYRRRSAGEIAG